MSENVFTKDPGATKDYTVDWTAWLAGDTIQSSSWTAQTGITKQSESLVDQTAVVWLSGGSAFNRYRVTNRIVTAGGRTEERSIYIVVSEQ